jgi:hypothetical protein
MERTALDFEPNFKSDEKPRRTTRARFKNEVYILPKLITHFHQTTKQLVPDNFLLSLTSSVPLKANGPSLSQ